MSIQDVAFQTAALMSYVILVASWKRLAQVRKEVEIPGWRFWVSGCGCAALSLAMTVPFVAVFFGRRWESLLVACITFSLTASICGIFAARPLRLLLFFGGVLVAGLLIEIPIGIL